MRKPSGLSRSAPPCLKPSWHLFSRRVQQHSVCVCVYIYIYIYTDSACSICPGPKMVSPDKNTLMPKYTPHGHMEPWGHYLYFKPSACLTSQLLYSFTRCRFQESPKLCIFRALYQALREIKIIPNRYLDLKLAHYETYFPNFELSTTGSDRLPTQKITLRVQRTQ